MDYFPYGAPRLDEKSGSYNEKRKYIGQQYDAETELSYLNARYYNGGRGGFISQDPVFWGSPKGQNLSDPQSLNSYSYALDNPITGEDPSGRVSIFQQIIGLAKQAIGLIQQQIVSIASKAGVAAVSGMRQAAGQTTGALVQGTQNAYNNFSSNPVAQGIVFGAVIIISEGGLSPALDESTAGVAETNLENVEIKSFGKTIYTGSRDLSGVMDDIESGTLQDNGIFRNDKNLLPPQQPGYYKEYVVPDTPNYSNPGAGPERIVQGQNGETFYTPDHYKSFIKLK